MNDTTPEVQISLDGLPQLRTLWPHEHHKLEAHLLRLTPEERYLRFAGNLGEESIRRYCRRARWWQGHLVGLVDDAGELRAVGEARFRRNGWIREAELAFSVETSYQGRGLGTELFRRLLVHARNRAVARVYITSLPSNSRMRRIAAKFGLSVRSDGNGQSDGRIELHGPDYGSLFSEVLDEGTGQLIAGLRVQRIRGTPESTADDPDPRA
jgi:RimJ/RimL family protein N-acetyltransferase